jgi:hypothetical protein
MEKIIKESITDKEEIKYTTSEQRRKIAKYFENKPFFILRA